MSPQVYLVWVNDWLMGVYASRPSANRRMDAYRKENQDHPWYRLPSGRWYQHGGGVARLEVELREVLP